MLCTGCHSEIRNSVLSFAVLVFLAVDKAGLEQANGRRLTDIFFAVMICTKVMMIVLCVVVDVLLMLRSKHKTNQIQAQLGYYFHG